MSGPFFYSNTRFFVCGSLAIYSHSRGSQLYKTIQVCISMVLLHTYCNFMQPFALHIFCTLFTFPFRFALVRFALFAFHGSFNSTICLYHHFGIDTIEPSVLMQSRFAMMTWDVLGSDHDYINENQCNECRNVPLRALQCTQHEVLRHLLWFLPRWQYNKLHRNHLRPLQPVQVWIAPELTLT